MPVNLVALRNELITDPRALGLAALDDEKAAAKLNVRGVTGETLQPTSISIADLQRAVVGSEFLALLDAQRDLWLAILSSSVNSIINPKDMNVRGQIAQVWGVGTTTRDNLIALQIRSASRAEILFGEDVIVTALDVNRARNS